MIDGIKLIIGALPDEYDIAPKRKEAKDITAKTRFIIDNDTEKCLTDMSSNMAIYIQILLIIMLVDDILSSKTAQSQ